MFKTNVAVHLSKPITSTINADNLTTEKRWERSVLAALLQAEWVTKVYSVTPIWQSSEPKPDKFIDGLPLEEASNVIGFFYNHIEIAEKFNFKGLVFETMGELVNRQDKWIPLKEKYQDKLICSGPYSKEPYLEQFFITLGKQYMEELPLLLVPNTFNTDCFNNKIILWPSGNFPYIILGHHGNMYDKFFSWLCSKLKADSSMEFHALTGINFNQKSFKDEEDIYLQLFNSLATSSLKDYKTQVKLYPQLGWDKIWNLFEDVKLNIAQYTMFCNTHTEAGAYGIPTIVNTNSEKEKLFLTSGAYEGMQSDHYWSMLTKLDQDHDFYTEQGDIYRDYVNDSCTYKAFTDKVYKILLKRKMINV